MKELKIRMDVYFPMKEGETKEQAVANAEDFLGNVFHQCDISHQIYQKDIQEAF